MRLTHTKLKFLKDKMERNVLIMKDMSQEEIDNQSVPMDYGEWKSLVEGIEGLLGPQVVPDKPLCCYCMRHPEEISEYQKGGGFNDDQDPDDYVRQEEGTYNIQTKHFACTECYVKIGQPSAPWPGWRAP